MNGDESLMETKVDEEKIIEVTGVVEYVSTRNFGIKFKDNPNWVNLKPTEEDQPKIFDELANLKKGSKIKLTLGKTPTWEVLEAPKEDPYKDSPKREGGKDGKNWQDEIVLFTELLEQANRSGIKEIRTELIEFNIEKKYAVCKAYVTTDTGKLFEAHGDATQDNVKAVVKEHFIRLAETRAIGRCLRFMLAKGTMEEELHE